MSSITTDITVPASGQLHRTIDWRGAFWVASGVPALVLFSIGGIAGTTGNLAFAIWIASVVLGLIQSFTYAEIAGLFPIEVGWRLGLRRDGVAALLQVHRAAFGLVQLACLDAGAVARLLHRRGLHTCPRWRRFRALPTPRRRWLPGSPTPPMSAKRRPTPSPH